MLDRLTKNWQALGLIAAILAAGGGGALAYNDVLIQVAANTSYRVIQEFERLDLIRKRRPLSQVEWLKWCETGKALGVFKVCPPRRR